MKNITIGNFEEWRSVARNCCLANISPQEIIWHDKEKQKLLFLDNFMPIRVRGELKVSSDFIAFAKIISSHSNPQRWAMLYEALWRITHKEKHLFAISTDPLVHELNLMNKAVRRDAHKAKAFIRFKKYTYEGKDIYTAWHEPDHQILSIIGPFFSRRYSDMVWSVFTPTESMHWDLETLHFGKGSTKKKVIIEDEMDMLWKDYYRAIFNPARIKIKAMKREMPVRYWKNLPEASIISNLLREAPSRIDAMLKHTEGWNKSATDFIPPIHDINILRLAAKKCEGCPLYVTGTQTVFGEGPKNARMMIIGEQPGYEEDRLGKPFIGPAGKLLDQALNSAELNRSKIYLTNAVKHFEFNIVEGRKKSVTPNLRKIIDCNAWLEAEIKAIQPHVIVTLGVVAGRALFGSSFNLKESHTKLRLFGDIKVASTIHPSYILRTKNLLKKRELFEYLVNDLVNAKNNIDIESYVGAS